MCYCVPWSIVYALGNKMVTREAMLDSVSSDLGALSYSGPEEKVLGEIWQALVCHGVRWSSCIHLKPKETKGKRACQCTERPWT